MLIGGNGNDEIDGGTGTDMAVWFGALADYEVAYQANATIGTVDLLIRHKPSGDVDTVRDVELFQVGAATYSLSAGQVQVANGAYVELSGYVQPVITGQLAGVAFNAEWVA